MALVNAQPNGQDDERRLIAMGLSTELIHNGLRRGVVRAANRSSYALKTAPGTDIYQDGMEDFTELLTADGWRAVDIEGQPRLLHPAGLLAFTISSGINVGKPELHCRLRTRRKGKTTKGSLAPRPQHPVLFGDPVDTAGPVEESASAPFYFLLCERAGLDGGVYIELARPAGMTDGGCVNAWSDRIRVGFFPLEGDLSVFDQPGDDGPDGFDVPVEPR